jgi:nucleotide-binding universal stress UspA family protein
MFKRILLATDGSPIIERTVLYAGHLARTDHAEIVVVHAYDPPQQYHSYAGYERLATAYRAVAQAVVDEAVQLLRADGAVAWGDVRLGPAAEVIIAAAEEHDVDVIVMGTRGMTNLQEILGSVSAQVLRSVRCPVLQIPSLQPRPASPSLQPHLGQSAGRAVIGTHAVVHSALPCCPQQGPSTWQNHAVWRSGGWLCYSRGTAWQERHERRRVHGYLCCPAQLY